MSHFSEPERQRIREALLTGPMAPSCPTDETLWQGASGELPPQTLVELLDHLGRCGSCAQVWAMAEQALSLPVEPQQAQDLTPANRGPWIAGAIGLALVAMAALTLLPPEPSPFRAEQTAQIELQLAEGLIIPRTGVMLTWQPLPHARYEVNVTTPDLTDVMLATGLQEPQVRLGAEHLTDLASGTALWWRVTAILPDGERRSSPTGRLLLE